MAYRLGVDIGGTFTDFALIDEATGDIAVHKQLTTPHDPSESVLGGVEALLARRGVALGDVTSLVHGSTLVTNAVIERKGAVTGMLVTAGFSDVLDIALERRYDLYDLHIAFPPPVVPAARRAEVAERVRWDGSVETPLDEAQVREAVGRLAATGIEALAICFLHAYRNPDHERRAAAIAAEAFPDLYLSVSSEVFPHIREYERWTTTTINAYTQPTCDRYLGRLESGLAERGFRGTFSIMTSSGGTVTAATARRFPVRMLESGPAAGALMSAFLGRRLGRPSLLSFDMGGTTAKGALVRDGHPVKHYEMEVARIHEFKRGSGLPVKVPSIDMIEIGAGGGSIATVDERGVIRVGPESAGAAPGPACYGRGGRRATLSDANLLLGYYDPAFFLGGQMRLDVEAARAAIAADVGDRLGLDSVRAAWGIHEVINEDVARAFRVHASERGFDYRGASMIAFGGSGPAHAMRIARKLRIPRVIFPAGAGVMSAFGMLVSPFTFELAQSHRTRVDTLDGAGLAGRFAALEAEARDQLRQAGVAAADIRLTRRLDMRYRGQGYEVEVTLPDSASPDALVAALPDLFREAYLAVFSIGLNEEPLEIENWKVEAVGPTPAMAEQYRLAGVEPAPAALKGTRRAWFAGQAEPVDCPVYDRYALDEGAIVEGPAFVEERESTCVLGPGDRALRDGQGNLVAEPATDA